MEYTKIIAQLKQLNADILLLQELDAYCERSGDIDVATLIAGECE